MSRSVSYAASVALGAAFAAVAFGAKGGSDISRATAAEVPLVIAGGLIAAICVTRARRGPVYGGVTLGLFALLAALTALSMSWSIVPDLTWIEANRTLAYLAVFAAAVAVVRVVPEGWICLLRGILIGATVIVVYALTSRIWPDVFSPDLTYARIGEPYGYWNAVGVTAAIAVPPTLWLGARRSGHAAASALAFPLMGLLVVALVLCYSRGAMIAAVVAAALWLAFVPLRLRSLAVLVAGTVGALPVILWALAKDAFTKNFQPVGVLQSISDEFGLLLATMTGGLLLVGLAVNYRVGRAPPSIAFRRRVGVAAVVAVALTPFVLLSAMALGDEGIGGTISARAKELTSETAGVGNTPERLTRASSSRGRYWRQAGGIFEDNVVAGTGAGTFGVARLRYRKDDLVARHAHGFVPQTMADLGLAGLLLTVALAAAWLVAAWRTTGAHVRGPARPWDAERTGLVALALAAIVFGIHSALDWTWFVPAPAVMAMAAAGFVAGRGRPALLAAGPASPSMLAPKEEASTAAGEGGGPAPTATVEGPVGGFPHLGAPTERACERTREEGAPQPAHPPTPRALHPRVRWALAGALLLTTLVCTWAVWQPERSDNESNRALRLADERRFEEAAEVADRAHRIDPLAPKPLLVAASVEDAAGRPDRALRDLERAVAEYPRDPQVWVRLAEFQLNRLGRPQDALRTLEGALYLDPRSRPARAIFLAATRRARGGAPAPPPPPG